MNPQERLKGEIQNLQMNSDFLRQHPDKEAVSHLVGLDLERSIVEIKEIFSDLAKQVIGCQRINLTIKGKLGGNRGRWYAAPKWKELTI
ncbi:MAG: hypothetical protein O8C67_10780 [Candidatus Methanoperedens sp.]|nr:hypothetical protein [Candidatus Methanoperedens sp.]